MIPPIKLEYSAKFEKKGNRNFDAAAMTALANLKVVAENCAKRILIRARANIQDDGLIETGLLKKSLAVKSNVVRIRAEGGKGKYLGGRFYAIVGHDTAVVAEIDGKMIKPYKYSHLIEEGHRIVVARGKQKGKVVGHDAESYFYMSRAANAEIEAIEEAFAREAEKMFNADLEYLK